MCWLTVPRSCSFLRQDPKRRQLQPGAFPTPSNHSPVFGFNVTFSPAYPAWDNPCHLIHAHASWIRRGSRYIYLLSLKSPRRPLPLFGVFLMSSPGPPALQGLRHLNRSSTNFHDQLNKILSGDEYQQCAQNLQGDDLVWLVDYLDKVRRRLALAHPLPKPLQVLGSLELSSRASRKCLCELRSICGANGILPTSYTITSHLNVESDPFAFGGFGDVYHGTLDGSRVCIKRVRVYTEDDTKKASKVLSTL